MKPARFPFLSNVVLFLPTEMIAQGNWVPAWGHVSAAPSLSSPSGGIMVMHMVWWERGLLKPGLSRLPGRLLSGCLFQKFPSRFDLYVCIFILPLKHAVNSLEQNAHEVPLPASRWIAPTVDGFAARQLRRWTQGLSRTILSPPTLTSSQQDVELLKVRVWTCDGRSGSLNYPRMHCRMAAYHQEPQTHGASCAHTEQGLLERDRRTPHGAGD